MRIEEVRKGSGSGDGDEDGEWGRGRCEGTSSGIGMKGECVLCACPLEQGKD